VGENASQKMKKVKRHFLRDASPEFRIEPHAFCVSICTFVPAQSKQPEHLLTRHRLSSHSLLLYLIYYYDST
jgi:hypothetical protein